MSVFSGSGPPQYHSVTLQALYISYLPTPLVLLTSEDGSQNVHIAPEAFAVASAEFAEQIEFWQDSLPGDLKGQLASVLIVVACMAYATD